MNAITRYEISAALLLAFERILSALAMVFLVLASYAWWGSPASPLRPLWMVAIACVVIGFIFKRIHHYCLKQIVRLDPEIVEEVQQWTSYSRLDVQKLKDEKSDD